MRRKKELNVFNLSFLDILAGALGAVIILFIVVPKMDLQDIKKLQTLEILEQEVSSIDSLLSIIKNSVPSSDYKELMEHSGKIQATIQALNDEIEQLQSNLSQKSKENKQLRLELIDTRKKLQDQRRYTDEIKNLKKDLTAMTRKYEVERANRISAQKEAREWKAKKTPVHVPIVERKDPIRPNQRVAVRDTTPGKGDAIFGINPPLTIMVNWDNSKDKVRLYLNKKGSNLWCYYQTKRRRTPFGRWEKLPSRLTNKPYEVIIQSENLIPGEYNVHAQLQKTKTGSADISGFIAMNITGKPVKKIDFPTKKIIKTESPLKGGMESLLGTLRVTDNDIFWTPKN